MTKQEILDKFSDIDFVYNDSSKHETLSRMLDELLKEQDSRIKKYEYMFNFLGIGFREWATKIIDGEAEAICEVDEHERKTTLTFKMI